MDYHLILCLIIFTATIISYILNKVPMWVTSLVSMLLLVLTGCLKGETALSGFSNPNTILMASMFMVAAGLRKTSFVHYLCERIMKLTKGSFKLALFGYIVITMILANFISSPMVVFAIVSPLVAALCDENNVSKSKVMFPICVVAIACTMILPTDAAITQAGQNNAFLQTYEYTAFQMNPMDFLIAKWPLFIIMPIWALFLAPKFMPDTADTAAVQKNENRAQTKPLSSFSDKVGIAIFFLTIICLLFSAQLHVDGWVIAAVGGILMVLCHTLTPKEAIQAMPLDMTLLFIGALALGSSLSETGAGDMIGQWLSNAVGGTQNSYILGAMFFIIPFIVTQFMLNRAVIQIFTPICILTCKALGANPVGPMLLVVAGCLTAFLTPMATPAIPMTMAEGNYNLKDLLKGGWMITLILMVFYVFYVMTIYPAFA
ncbi:MAG TPA: SLC13 family permease [Lachnospiraceae bacterium]|nr:SLC13 family permease [Lachnospiraceae bacterium]